MMLQSLYEAEIAEADACFPLSSRSRVKRNVALYAEMLGFPSPTICPPDRYIKPRADLRAFVATHAPKTLARNTVKNCYNDNAKLIESGIARGWLAAPTSPLYPWPHPDRHIPVEGGKRKRFHRGTFDDRPSEHRTSYRLKTWPRLFAQEVWNYLWWCEHPQERHPVLGRPPERVQKNVRSANELARRLIRVAGYAVSVAGLDADTLTLRQICEPAFVEGFKEWLITRRGKCTANVEMLLTDLKTIARYWLRQDESVQGMLQIFRELPTVEAVHDKEGLWLDLEEIDCIGQSRHPSNPRRRDFFPTYYQQWLFHHLEDPLEYPAYHGWSQKVMAMWVGLSLMLRLWCHRPLRSRQMRELKLSSLEPQANGEYLMVIKGKDLKVARRGGQENRWEAHFPKSLLPLLDEWRQRWRPLLIPGPDYPYLFVNSRGHLWVDNVLTALVERTTGEFTQQRVGGPVAINPHQIRSLWASQMVMAGLNFADIVRLIGDTPNMVWKRYFLNQRKRPISQWTKDLAKAIGEGTD